MSNSIKNWTFISLLALLTACGGSDLDEQQAQQDDAQDIADQTGADADVIDTDTASDVITTTADVNGFRIVSNILNPWGADYAGTEVVITAFVKDRSNNGVKDGTVVTFVADDNGLIQDQCVTENGQCSVSWWSAGDRTQPNDPDAGDDPVYAVNSNDFNVTIMARTIGQDSFIDKNANSLFDVGETYFTQSEPFIDANDDGVYNAGANDFDEFFDYNNNGQFDGDDAFNRFRGDACTDAARSAGHCAGMLEVWDSIKLINSSGDYVHVVVDDCGSPATVYRDTRDGTEATLNVPVEGVTVCIEFLDQFNNIPPVDTKIDYGSTNSLFFSGDEDKIPNVYSPPGTGYRTQLTIVPNGAGVGQFIAETESVDGVKGYATFPLILN